MASPIILQFDDEPILAKLFVQEESFSENLNTFLKKYIEIFPDIEQRFKYDENEEELHFILGDSDEYESTDEDSEFLLSFFESNLDISRPINGFGKKLDESFYKDLFSLMETNGKMYWSNGGDSLCINFIGDFDFESYCYVKKNGLFWEVD